MLLRWLVPRLRGFQDRHPEIELNLDPDDDLIDFHSEPAELAIRYGEGGWQGCRCPPIDSRCRLSRLQSRLPG